jgi:hypothetical protein
MSAKRVINNKAYLVAGDASGDVTGDAVDIAGVDKICFQVSWTGTPTAVLEIEISNDGLLWTTSAAAAIAEPAGSVGNTMIELETAAAFARLFFDRTSGSGTVSAHIVGKGWQ